jgi:anti-sigma regulatory factor (Ser/Thr protein kinase)
VSSTGFLHEAVFYEGERGFVDATVPFIADAVAADEPILVVVSARKIDLLRRQLDGAADRVEFADMADVGRNPARIIPAWREFVDANAGGGRRVRGIGEPAFPERTLDELDECRRHEALLNVAFDDGPPWWLVCPYDVSALPADVVELARTTHPVLRRDGEAVDSDHYHGHDLGPQALGDLLPEPPPSAVSIEIERHAIAAVRSFVAAQASAAGLVGRRASDLVLAVDELATNSVRHGGGRGLLRVWRDAGAVVCEVRDDGRVPHALVGRVRPPVEQIGGRGLWLVNQLCDLVQLRSTPEGTSVRVHMSMAESRAGVAPGSGAMVAPWLTR